MKIKEYQKKFEDLFYELEKEHGSVAYVHIEPCVRFEIPTQGVNETLAKCNIKFEQGECYGKRRTESAAYGKIQHR